MAIDTRDKRSSALGAVGVWLVQAPNPDGAALSQGDRQHVGWIYRGILAAGAAAAVVMLTARKWWGPEG